MNYSILTQSEFFKLLDSNQSTDIQPAYNNLVKQIIELCQNRVEIGTTIIILTYTEIELQYMIDAVDNGLIRHAHKAQTFVRKMLKHLLSHISFEPTTYSSSLKWTGSFVEFVELIYGLQEMESIADGKITINELFVLFGKLLNIETKENLCYNAYTDIKRRKSKSESRTYFLDKMCKRLNLRMQRDDERELRRR